jgi:hypothetical protein
LRVRKRSVDATLQLEEPRFEDAALCFSVCSELFEPLAQLELRGCKPLLDGGDDLVTPCLDRSFRVRKAPVEPLLRGLADVCDALRHHALRLFSERFDGPLELA